MQYLGPSPTQLVLLFVFLVVDTVTCFAVGIIFLRSLWCLGANTTTIEGWEIERHHVLLRRAKYLGGYLEGPDGTRVRIEKQEFPFDIGIWSNIVQGMDGSPLTWFLPFAPSPSSDGGLEYDVNGFEGASKPFPSHSPGERQKRDRNLPAEHADASLTWPPPDPDRSVRMPVQETPAFTHATRPESDGDRLQAFQERQKADLERVRSDGRSYRRRAFHERFGDEAADVGDDRHVGAAGGGGREAGGEEAWRNSEGERLGDFGVDEDAEFYDEDEIPLARLIQKKRTIPK